MGDGRYYTYEQFYMIVWLTFLTIMSVYSLINHFYKSKQHPKGKVLFIFYGCLLTLVGLKTMGQLTPTLDTAYFIHILSIFLTSVLWVCLILLLNQNKKNDVLIYSFGLFNLWVLVKPQILISKFNFLYYEYSVFYFMWVILYLVIASYFLMKLYRSNRLIHQLYNNQTLVLTTATTLLLPYILYIVLACLHLNWIPIMEVLLLFLFVLNVNFLSHFPGQNSITSLAFGNLSDVLTEGIFVVDIYGKVLIRNKTASQDLFTDQNKIDLMDLKSLFKEIPKTEILTNDVHEFQINDQFYQLQLKKLESKGYLISIINVTKIHHAITQLKTNHLEEERINAMLQNESKISYDLSRETLIKEYMDEIMNTQGELIYQLLEEIDLLESNDISFDMVIKKSKEILDDVRQSVSLFRNYHGGIK
ncbi:MAG: hypothetical protein JXR88_02415 [Clostridia bacterium]|nr:hypothetical protein [Clostridia bacterium]